MHLVELDVRWVCTERNGVERIVYGRGGVDDLEHSLDPDPRPLPRDQQRHHLAHRSGQLAEIGHEREKRAERDPALQCQPATQQQHADLPQRRDHLQHRL